MFEDGLDGAHEKEEGAEIRVGWEREGHLPMALETRKEGLD